FISLIQDIYDIVSSSLEDDMGYEVTNIEINMRCEQSRKILNFCRYMNTKTKHEELSHHNYEYALQSEQKEEEQGPKEKHQEMTQQNHVKIGLLGKIKKESSITQERTPLEAIKRYKDAQEGWYLSGDNL
ncbi:hypothetical protein ACJX0J_022252, partial [Zea mays]